MSKILLVLLALLLFSGVASAANDHVDAVNITGCYFKSAYRDTEGGVNDAGYCGIWKTSLFEGNILVGRGYIKLPDNLNTSKPFYLNLYYAKDYGTQSYNSVGTKINVISSEPDWSNFTYLVNRPTDTDVYGTSTKTVNFDIEGVWLNYTINFTQYDYGLHYYYTSPYLGYVDYPDQFDFTDNYISGYFFDAPQIISWSNNKTNDNQTEINFTKGVDKFIMFNVTANQTVNFNWTLNTTGWYHVYSTGLMNESTFNLNLSYPAINDWFILKVNATNVNGTSNTITWNIISQAPDPSGYVKFKDTDNSINNLQNAYVKYNSTCFNYTNSTGYYKLPCTPAVPFTLSANWTKVSISSESITVNNIEVSNDFELDYSKPFIGSPYYSGQFIKGKYSHNFKTLKLWENPFFVWGEYKIEGKNTSAYKTCEYEGSNIFSCPRLSDMNYTFNFLYADIYNYALGTFHPTKSGMRNFTSSTIYDAIGLSTEPFEKISILPQAEREAHIKDYMYDIIFLFIIVILVMFAMTWGDRR